MVALGGTVTPGRRGPFLRHRLTRSLRTRVVLVLGLLGIAGLLGLRVLLGPAVIARFDALERQGLEHDVQRAATLIRSDVETLSRVGINFAAWDEAYRYIQSPGRAFEDANLVPGTYEGTSANLLAYVRLDGRVLVARGYDLQRHLAQTPDTQVLRVLTRPAVLARLRDPAAHVEGVLAVAAASEPPAASWLVSVRPVTTNAGRGPVRGALILGRALNVAAVQQLRDQTQLDLRVLPLPGAAHIVSPGLTLSAPSSSRVTAQIPLAGVDLAGAPSPRLQTASFPPAVLLQVSDRRQLHLLGLTTAGAVLLSTGVVMLLFTVITVLMLDASVLSRLAVYRGVVRRLGAVQATQRHTDWARSEPLSTPLERLPVEVRDELGELGSAFNGFLDELEGSRERLLWQARHDPLTGLPNRQLLSAHITGALRGRAGTAPTAGALSVALLDLDRFKTINDTLGHQVGDEVLQVVAARLVRALPDSAVVARLGGDEFAVLLPSLPNRAQPQLEYALQEVARPIQTQAGEVRVGASVGVTGTRLPARNPASGDPPPGDPDTPGPDAAPTDWVTLMRQADVAMYRAKQAGEAVCVFTPALLQVVEERARLEHALAGAAERGELRLVYQPVVRLALAAPLERGAPLQGPVVVGVEALLRWRHPQLGEVSPARFIPLAEENGQVRALGAWVLDRALRFCARQPGLRVAVNVSAAQLGDAGFVDGVLGALERHRIPPEQLELEVTETAVLSDLAHATAQLLALRQRGVWITLDDFGTGHSSLAVLSTLPIQKVKLDRQFLLGSLGSHRTLGVLRAVLEMAQGLGLDVVAEGIETAEQHDTLRRLGCPLGQGYLFSRPIEAGEVPQGKPAPDMRAS